jgi:carboxymethylenebutenolidase
MAFRARRIAARIWADSHAGGKVAEIVTKTIRCAGGLPAFLAMPGGAGKVPAIVLMHERYGLVKHTCDLAERFAREGYACIAPDFFHRHPDQEALHRGDVGYPLKDPESVAFLNTAIDELVAMPQVDPSRIAVKGVCQTGRHPLVIAAERPIAAALVWYGAASEREWKVDERYTKPLDDIIARVDCPVLGIFGEADHLISLADVRRFRDCLERHDKSYTIRVYAGAPHGWLNDTMPGRYRREAAEAAWALQLAFLKNALDPARDKKKRVQVYESEHSADYDFTKNVRME